MWWSTTPTFKSVCICYKNLYLNQSVMSVSDGDCEGYGSGEILAYESVSESDGYVDEEAKAVLRSFKR